MESQRVVKDVPSPVEVMFLSVDESATDADGSVTYTSVHSDGSAGPAGTASKPAGVGLYRAVVTLATYDTLEFTFTGTVGGSPVTLRVSVEVVGGRLFTLAQLRNFDSALVNTPLAKLRRARDFVETEFERNTGRSFIPRVTTDVHNSGYGAGSELWLSRADPAEVVRVMVDGLDVTEEYAVSRGEGHYSLMRDNGTWHGNVAVTYRYGLTPAPTDVVEAALKRAARKVLGAGSRIDDRAMTMSIPDFGTFQLATPGQRGSITGIPEVDVVLNDYDIRTDGIR